jgi:hypothetical protein
VGVSAISGNEMTEMCHGCLGMEKGNTVTPIPRQGRSLARGGLGEELLPLAIFFVDSRHVAMR